MQTQEKTTYRLRHKVRGRQQCAPGHIPFGAEAVIPRGSKVTVLCYGPRDTQAKAVITDGDAFAIVETAALVEIKRRVKQPPHEEGRYDEIFQGKQHA